MATHTNTTPPGVPATGLPSVPIDIKAVIQHLAMRPREAEAFVSGLAHALIEAKDTVDLDPDLENTGDDEPSGDEQEPSLGAPEIEYTLRGLPEARGHVDQRRWSDGHADGHSNDLELVDEDGDVLDLGEDVNEDGCDMQGSDNGLGDGDGAAEQWGHASVGQCFV